MKYAIIKTGGKQYQVKEGQTLKVELLGLTGDSVVFDQVLLVVDGDNVELGTPTVSGTKVYGTVLGDVKADKIEVFKYKSKSRYRKHTGHRQKLTHVKIVSIGEPAKSAKPAKPTVTKQPAAKKASPKKAAAKKTAK